VESFNWGGQVAVVRPNMVDEKSEERRCEICGFVTENDRVYMVSTWKLGGRKMSMFRQAHRKCAETVGYTYRKQSGIWKRPKGE